MEFHASVREFAADAATRHIEDALHHDNVMYVPPVRVEPVGTVIFAGEDDSGHRFTVELPRFDDAQFPASLRALIPDEDFFFVDHDSTCAKIAVAFANRDCPVLIGPPGVGKTIALEYMAACMRVPYVRDQFDASTEVSRVAGKPVIGVDPDARVSVSRYQLSSFLRVLSWPSIYAADELNAAEDEIRMFLRPTLDATRAVALEEWDGRVIARNPYCYIAATGNEPWKVRNTSIMEFAEADRDRMAAVLVEYPRANAEFAILANMLAVSDLRDKVTPVQVVNSIALFRKLRELTERGETSLTAGVRALMRFVACLGRAPATIAFAMTFEAADPHDVEPFRSCLDLEMLAPDAVVSNHEVVAELDEVQAALVAKNTWEAE